MSGRLEAMVAKDAAQYYGLTRSLVDSGFTKYEFGNTAAIRPPVMPFLGALLHVAITDKHNFLMAWAVLQAFMGAATMCLVYATALRLGLKPSLWVVLALCVLDPTAHYESTRYLSDTLYTLFFAFSLWRWVSAESWKGFFVAGALSGLAILTRPVGTYWPIVAGVVIVIPTLLHYHCFAFVYLMGVAGVVFSLQTGAGSTSQKYNTYFGIVTCGDALRLDVPQAALRQQRSEPWVEFLLSNPSAQAQHEWLARRLDGAMLRSWPFFPQVAARHLTSTLLRWPPLIHRHKPERAAWKEAAYWALGIGGLLASLYVYGASWLMALWAAKHRIPWLPVLVFLLPAVYHCALSWGPMAAPRFRLPFYPWLIVLASSWRWKK